MNNISKYVRQTMNNLLIKYGSNEYVKAYFTLCENILFYLNKGLNFKTEYIEEIYNYYVQTIENNK